MQGIVEFREQLFQLLANIVAALSSMQFIKGRAMTFGDLIVELQIRFIAGFCPMRTVQKLIRNPLKSRDHDHNRFFSRFTQNDARNFFQALRICDGRTAEFHYFHRAL